MNNFDQKGFGLVEIIIAATIGTIVFLSAILYLNFSLKIVAEDINRAEALYFAKSSLEQARSVRDEDWTNINALVKGSEYYFEADASDPKKWIPVFGSKTIGRYTVQIVSSDVYRVLDGGIYKDIVSSGGALDVETLKITSSVSYQTKNGIKQIELHEYLTNF
ncbi:MAG: prepilin-type N-terminal cleavage/methylation domain-containing protein [Candidatus Pacebacteria bacterium]|nr:prepilin-type N-terminal cleavage/methylation domain-containing protein [Candidatus Paceibacterota bacterium]